MNFELTKTVLLRLREQFIDVEKSEEWYSCTFTSYSLTRMDQRGAAPGTFPSLPRLEQKSFYRPHWIRLPSRQRSADGEAALTFGRLEFITKLSAERRFFLLAPQFENCFTSLPDSVWSLFSGEFDPRQLPQDFTQEIEFRAAFRWVLMVFELARMQLPGLPAISRSDFPTESDVKWPISTYQSWLQIPAAADLSSRYSLVYCSEHIRDLFSASRAAVDVFLDVWDTSSPTNTLPTSSKQPDEGHFNAPTEAVEVSVNQIAAILKVSASTVGHWSENWGKPIQKALGRRPALWDYSVVCRWLIDNDKATPNILPLVPPPHVRQPRHNKRNTR